MGQGNSTPDLNDAFRHYGGNGIKDLLQETHFNEHQLNTWYRIFIQVRTSPLCIE